MMKKKMHNVTYFTILELSRNKCKGELCRMNFNMELPGLKGVNIEGIVEQENRMLVYISMPVKEHRCPVCGAKTTRLSNA